MHFHASIAIRRKGELKEGCAYVTLSEWRSSEWKSELPVEEAVLLLPHAQLGAPVHWIPTRVTTQ